MRITVVRSGGFAGVTRTYSVDSADLSPADASALDDLAHVVVRSLAGAPVGGAAGRRRTRQPGPPDAFQYDLVIEDAATEHRCTCTDPGPSPALELARSVIAHAGRA